MATKKTNGNVTENTVVDGAETVAAKLRKAKAQVWYLNADSDESNSPRENVTGIRFKFANGVVRDISDSFNEHIHNCAFWQGLATRIQRSYQNEKEINAVITSVDETLDDLMNGVWIEMSEGEPKVTMLAKAVKLALESAGETVDDTRFKSIIEKLADVEYRKKAKANAVVAANLAQLKVESAQRHAAEALEAASKNADVNELLG